MTTKDYKPPMKAEVQTDKRGNRRVRASRQYLEGLMLSRDDARILTEQLAGQSICPPLVWFSDTPEVRRILGVTA